MTTESTNPPALPTDGGSPPQEPTSPAPDLGALMSAMEQRMAARFEALAQQTAQPGPNTTPPAEEGYIDPDVEKVVNKRLAELEARQAQMINQTAERLDAAEFHAEVQRLGVDPALAKAGDALYLSWIQRGMQLADGSRPRRIDALDFVLGQQQRGTLAKTREQAAADRARALEQTAAFTERGGGSPLPPGTPDPEKLSREERLTKYYPAVLDREPW